MRLIDANALTDAIEKQEMLRLSMIYGIGADMAIDHIRWKISEAPSIDIVRCKECKYGEAKSFRNSMGEDTVYLICDRVKGLIQPDDFCSYGKLSEKPTSSERRE